MKHERVVRKAMLIDRQIHFATPPLPHASSKFAVNCQTRLSYCF